MPYDHSWYVPHFADKVILRSCEDWRDIYTYTFQLMGQVGVGDESLTSADSPGGVGALEQPAGNAGAEGQLADEAETKSVEDRLEEKAVHTVESLYKKFEQRWMTFVGAIMQSTHLYHDVEEDLDPREVAENAATVKIETRISQADVDPSRIEKMGNGSFAENGGNGYDASENYIPIKRRPGYIAIKDPSMDRLLKLERPANYANMTVSVMRYHLNRLVNSVENLFAAFWEGKSASELAPEDTHLKEALQHIGSPKTRDQLFFHVVAHEIHRRTSLLIENLSMTILTNFHIWQLENKGEFEDNLIASLKTDSYYFHDIGPKRWHVLTYLLDKLFMWCPGIDMLCSVGIAGTRGESG